MEDHHRADGGTVYFGCNDLHLYAVNTADGRLLWRYLAPDYKYGDLYGSPRVDAERVYIGAKNDVLHAVSRPSVKAVWQAKLGSSVRGGLLFTATRIFVDVYGRSASAAGTAPAVARRTVRDTLPSYGSSHPT